MNAFENRASWSGGKGTSAEVPAITSSSPGHQNDLGPLEGTDAGWFRAQGRIKAEDVNPSWLTKKKNNNNKR